MIDNITDFYNNQFKSSKINNAETHMINNLTSAPRKEKGVDIPHIRNNILKAGVFQICDLLYLPVDAFGYKYLLVIVDVFNKLCDAEPLKFRDHDSTLKAFEAIYKRKILEIPDVLQCDAGSEFKGLEKDALFKDEQTRLKYALPNRHRQQSLVERKNKEIGSTIIKFQTAQEIVTHKVVKTWVRYLPALIQAINKRVTKYLVEPKLTDEVLSTKYSADLIPLHTHVRAILDFPMNPATKERIGNVFRAGDLRWGQDDRTVEKIILNPNLPPMYQLNGNKNGLDNRVAYTKQQLQVINEKEIKLNAETLNVKDKAKKTKPIIAERIQPSRKAKK